jgi:hypothetical protein
VKDSPTRPMSQRGYPYLASARISRSAASGKTTRPSSSAVPGTPRSGPRMLVQKDPLLHADVKDQHIETSASTITSNPPASPRFKHLVLGEMRRGPYRYALSDGIMSCVYCSLYLVPIRSLPDIPISPYKYLRPIMTNQAP